MIIYKCDGERFSPARKCQSIYEAPSKDDKPYKWITINWSVKNELRDARLIEGNGLVHFCSRECLEFYLFKNNKADAIKKQHSLLVEAQKTITWMMENMKVDNPDLQSDSFNIPANTSEALKDYIKTMEENSEIAARF